MCQHRRFVCGSLFVFMAATHVGCAGSGLKNLFTRNETDGYHSLDELEAGKASDAVAVESKEKAEKPSVATRLASWHPFSKSERTEEDTPSTTDAMTADAHKDAAKDKPRFLGLSLAKREVVEPDPFLTTEPKPVDDSDLSPFTAAPRKELAKIDNKASQENGDSASEPGLNLKFGKEADTRIQPVKPQSDSNSKNAIALGATRKEASSASSSKDEDDALAKRFEQHFLLNSVGTVSKTESGAAAAGKDLQQKIASKTESGQRDLTSIAERQIDQFDFLLAADPDAKGKNSGFRRNSDVKPVKTAGKSDAFTENSGTSLAAFDQLMGTEGKVAAVDKIEVINTVTPRPKKKAAAIDVNVADAEALFGAAAARQKSLMQQPNLAAHTASPDRPGVESSVWAQTAENSEQFQLNDSSQGKSDSHSNRPRNDVAGAFAGPARSRTANSAERTHSTAFGVPRASAGNVVDDDSNAETGDLRLSNASAFSSDQRFVTANYGTVRPNVMHTVSAETSGARHPHFAAVPLAPVSSVAPVNESASAASQPGLVQSFSTRNWLLLIGGVIVIALLFAPGRTRPLTMNGRPANG